MGSGEPRQRGHWSGRTPHLREHSQLKLLSEMREGAPDSGLLVERRQLWARPRHGPLCARELFIQLDLFAGELTHERTKRCSNRVSLRNRFIALG